MNVIYLTSSDAKDATQMPVIHQTMEGALHYAQSSVFQGRPKQPASVVSLVESLPDLTKTMPRTPNNVPYPVVCFTSEEDTTIMVVWMLLVEN